MRIIAGHYGGRRLQVPKNKDIRPTSDKIRGAIFNALSGRIAFEGAHVLDCFCGTGALGFEALSRGAEECTFIDKAKDSLALAQENAKALDVNAQCRFIKKDVTKVDDLPASYDLIFMDPPYGQDLVSQALANKALQNALYEGAIVVAETEKEAVIFCNHFTLINQRVYGDSKITYLQYSGK